MFYLSCFNRSLIFLNTTPEFRHSQTLLSLLLPFCAPRFAFVKLLFLLSRPLCWMFPIGSCSFPYIQLNGSQPYRLLLHWLIALQNAVELLLWDLKRLRGRGSFSWQPWKSIENVHGQPGQPSTVWPQWVWWIYRNNIASPGLATVIYAYYICFHFEPPPAKQLLGNYETVKAGYHYYHVSRSLVR